MLDFTKFDFIDDETLCSAAATNPKFITLNLKGCVHLRPAGIRQALASRGKGLLSLDVSNGVRSCAEIFKPLNYHESKSSPIFTVDENEDNDEAANQAMDELVNEALGSLLTLSLSRCPGFSPTVLSFVVLRCTVNIHPS